MKDCPPGVLCLNYSKLVLIILILMFAIYWIKNEWNNSTYKLIDNNIKDVSIAMQKENKILNNKIEEIKEKEKTKLIQEDIPKSIDYLFHEYGSDKANIFKYNQKLGHGFSIFYEKKLEKYNVCK